MSTIGVRFIPSYVRSLQKLCVRACDTHLSCGLIISEVALPVAVIDDLCDYGKIYLGDESGDIKSDPNVNQNRTSWLRVKNDSAHAYARVPPGQYRSERLIADSVAAAGAAVHMLDQDLLSMTVSGAGAVMETTSLPEKVQNIQYVYLNADTWPELSATNQYWWRNLETLQMNIVYIKNRKHICMCIRTICRITTIQNLSIQYGYFTYPYSVTCSIFEQLLKLKRIDISFTNLLLVSDRNEDDMLLLRSDNRQYNANGRCLPGLGVLGKPLNFIGAVGCADIINCSFDANGDLLPKLLPRSKRSTTCRTMVTSFRACSYYWNSGPIFCHVTGHFMQSPHDGILRIKYWYWLKMFQLFIEWLDTFKPSESVDTWSDPPVHLYPHRFSVPLGDYLRTIALDRQERTTIFSHCLQMISRGYIIVGGDLIANLELQSRRHNHLPKKVIATLLTMCHNEQHDVYDALCILIVLLYLTSESPLICQQLLSDCFRKRFQLMCCKLIDLDWNGLERFGVDGHRACVYKLLVNIAEVEGLALRILENEALFAKVLRECRRTDKQQDPDEQRIRENTTRILCWMLLDLKNSPASQRHEDEIRAAVDDGLHKCTQSSYDSLVIFGRLLTSNIPSVIQFALREIHGMCCLSDEFRPHFLLSARTYCFMVHLEGLLPYIESISDDFEYTEPTGRWATEIQRAVKKATEGLVL